MRKAILLILMLECFQQELMAQEKEDKNTIRFNLTNPLIFGVNSLIFGYERVLKNNQSVSVNIGQADFPHLNLINSDSLHTNSKAEGKGINFSVDYRFYLSKENKYHAPRGIYIGPYYSYNSFERKNSWALKSTSGGSPQNVESKTTLSVHTVGFEMGYQFLLWNIISLDMILAGPGIANYNLKASLGTNLSEADKTKFFDNLNQALADKFPGYSRVIDEGEFKKRGTGKSTSFGYRYMIMLGYRF